MLILVSHHKPQLFWALQCGGWRAPPRMPDASSGLPTVNEVQIINVLWSRTVRKTSLWPLLLALWFFLWNFIVYTRDTDSVGWVLSLRGLAKNQPQRSKLPVSANHARIDKYMGTFWPKGPPPSAIPCRVPRYLKSHPSFREIFLTTSIFWKWLKSLALF